MIDAIRAVLEQSGAGSEGMTSVMIGTIQFINAFIEGRRLVPVATIRAGLPATESLHPMADFPQHLQQAIGRSSYLIGGGYEFDGHEFNALDDDAVRSALKKLELICPFYISQNDGTLMTAEFAEKYPILTFASGPTNSMRGAAFLSDVKDGIAIDIGGTTSDVGILKDGFPRESAMAVDIGSVRTNLRMPDILAIGLGGGSIVRETGGGATVGPDSVALKLTEKALVFGGDTLTATGIAVAVGLADLGEPEKVAGLKPELIKAAQAKIHRLLEQAVDRVKSSKGNVPVVLVGGGAILVDRNIKGASKVMRPENSGAANAIGAGLA